jgi:putative transposase
VIIVLPDHHLHSIRTLPNGDADFSERWWRIKGRFSHSVGAATPRSRSQFEKRECGLWQRRFWEHLVRDEEEFRARMEYCERNPVKHGLVAEAKDWPYSSFNKRWSDDG